MIIYRICWTDHENHWLQTLLQGQGQYPKAAEKSLKLAFPRISRWESYGFQPALNKGIPCSSGLGKATLLGSYHVKLRTETEKQQQAMQTETQRLLSVEKV